MSQACECCICCDVPAPSCPRPSDLFLCRECARAIHERHATPAAAVKAQARSQDRLRRLLDLHAPAPVIRHESEYLARATERVQEMARVN